MDRRFRHAETMGHEHVVAFATQLRLHGRGINWVDVHLLASAAASRLQVWTADASFAAIADEPGVSYRISD